MSFCPHHVGHYLGLDVHDVDQMSRSIKLQPGMIITIEPGYSIKIFIPLFQSQIEFKICYLLAS